MTRFIPFPCLALIVALAGCGDRTNPSQAGHTPSAAPASPAWVLAEAPADALGVAEVKAAAKEGDTVVVRGRIGGRADPMTEGSSILVIMDPSIPACSDNPEDRCATPWDYCCETPETISANNATVQVVDAAGAPITGSLSAAGLEPLAEIIVIGVVGPRPAPSVLTIRATGVHVVR